MIQCADNGSPLEEEKKMEQPVARNVAVGANRNQSEAAAADDSLGQRGVINSNSLPAQNDDDDDERVNARLIDNVINKEVKK